MPYIVFIRRFVCLMLNVISDAMAFIMDIPNIWTLVIFSVDDVNIETTYLLGPEKSTDVIACHDNKCRKTLWNDLG